MATQTWQSVLIIPYQASQQATKLLRHRGRSVNGGLTFPAGNFLHSPSLIFASLYGHLIQAQVAPLARFCSSSPIPKILNLFCTCRSVCGAGASLLLLAFPSFGNIHLLLLWALLLAVPFSLHCRVLDFSFPEALWRFSWSCSCGKPGPVAQHNHYCTPSEGHTVLSKVPGLPHTLALLSAVTTATALLVIGLLCCL